MSTRWSPSVVSTSVTVPPPSSFRPSCVEICLAPPRLEIRENPTIRKIPISST